MKSQEALGIIQEALNDKIHLVRLSLQRGNSAQAVSVQAELEKLEEANEFLIKLVEKNIKSSKKEAPVKGKVAEDKEDN